MTMNKLDAQAFFKCASKSFYQLKAIFVALEGEDTKIQLSQHARDLVGAGRHIADDMSEIVDCWALEAAEPWQDEQGTTQMQSALLDNDLCHEICSIKAMIDAAERATWQEGCIADDQDLVLDATYLMRDASSKLSLLMKKA